MSEVRKLSGKEMCEVIARNNIMVHENGTPWTPQEYWEYSPRGELDMVFVWYAMVMEGQDERSVS